MISTLKEEIKNKDEKLERNEQLLGTVQVSILQNCASVGPEANVTKLKS
jgi:hypothetical protein